MVLSKEDELFTARILDVAAQAEQKMYPKFTMFLDERQVYLADLQLRKNHCSNYLFFGGYEGAQRQMLGVFPSYMEPDPGSYPVAGLKLSYRRDEKLSHRDFLGSFMALGVKREVVGDILVGEGQTVVCLYEKQFDYFTDNLKKIGRVGVTLAPSNLEGISYTPSFRKIEGTVASLRLDAVVSLAVGTSREKAAERIRAGFVMLNYAVTESVSATVKPGDVFSVKGSGKFVLAEEIRETKKGRLYLIINQYI